MQTEDLLAIEPELLAKGILHRRERLIEVLPAQIGNRKKDLDLVEPIARDARNRRDEINNKVASLKVERDQFQNDAKKLYEQSNQLYEELIESGKIQQNPDPRWAKDKLAEKIAKLEAELETSAGDHKTEERFLRQMKDLVREHQTWVAERMEKNAEFSQMHQMKKDATAKLDSAQKAHEAMIALVDESGELHNTFSENEGLRRKAASRLSRAEAALKASISAAEFWQEHLEKGFADLLKDARRVESGGESTKAIAKKHRQESGGEEE